MRSSEIRQSKLPREFGPIVEVAPIEQTTRSTWLLLSEDGSLIHFDAGSLQAKHLASSAIVAEPDHEPWNNKLLRHRLHVSACARFAAVVNDYGKRGLILDIHRGVVTQELDGGHYDSETVPFSFAFVSARGRSLAVHRTDWNRLDVSDPATGECLTERAPTQYKSGEAQPEHYLDYFHGGLYPSPDHTYLLSDGWVWHPIGVPTVWRLDDWYQSNKWESEDGDSKLDVCGRSDWDRAICWVDEKRLAIGGIGEADQAMAEGARIFDVTLRGAPPPWARSDWRGPLETLTIQGPTGVFFSDGISLFSATPTGLSRWSLKSGIETGRIAGFNPAYHHRRARELVQLADGSLVRWSIPSE